MTINEKTRLLPKEYQKSYVIPIPQEDLNNNTSDSVLRDYDSYALTTEELTKYIQDPFWNRVRFITFSLYWTFCLIALLASFYIAMGALDGGFCDVDIPGSSGYPTLNNGTSMPPTSNDSAAVPGSDNGGVVLRMINQPS